MFADGFGNLDWVERLWWIWWRMRGRRGRKRKRKRRNSMGMERIFSVEV